MGWGIESRGERHWTNERRKWIFSGDYSVGTLNAWKPIINNILNHGASNKSKSNLDLCMLNQFRLFNFVGIFCTLLFGKVTFCDFLTISQICR